MILLLPPLPLLLLPLLTTATALTDILKCNSSSFLDQSLQCSQCLPGQVYNSNTCLCAKGTYLNRIVAGTQVAETCSPCANNSISTTLNALQCTPCQQNNCTCASTGAVVVTMDAVGNKLSSTECLTCPANAYVQNGECVSCSDRRMVTTPSGVCQCPSPPFYSTAFNGSCIETSIVNQILSEYATYGVYNYAIVSGGGGRRQESIRSVLGDLFVRVVAECRYFRNATACQVLGNMCVMQMYERSSAECAAYISAARSAGVDTRISTDTPRNMPWLYYGLISGEDANAVLRKSVGTFETYPMLRANKLKLVLVRYSFHGVLLGVEEASSQFITCPIDSLRVRDYLRLGTMVSVECRLNLRNYLVSAAETVFYDLYVVNAQNKLQGVPVMIRNVKGNENQPLGSVSGAVLVRRFYLVDMLSGVTGSGVQIVSVLTRATLYVSLQGNSVQMPYISLQYEQRQLSSLSADDTSIVSTVQASFQSIYATETRFWSSMNSALIAFAVMLALFWAYTSHNWNRKNQRPSEPLTIPVMIQWSILAARLISYVFTLMLLCVCLYWFIGAKGQADTLILAPTDAFTLGMFDTALMLLLGCSVVYTLHALYRQCTIDLYFLDWEKPRQEKVSVWRLLFAANEWIRLQNYRRILVEVVLVLMIVIMLGADVRHLAVAYPEMTIEVSGKPNRILLFAINGLIWFGACFTLWLYRWVVYDRFYENQLLQFVDLISLQNVSLLVLDCRFHGYYVHGRTVFPCADTTMEELNANLKKERDNLVAKRGLLNSDQQTFEIFVTQSFRSATDRLFSIMKTTGTLLGTRRMSRDESEGKVAESMNKFLCNFIDNSLKENKYAVRDMTFMERYCGASPGTEGGINVFLKDGGHSFSNSLMYGLEMDLLLMYFLVYSMFDTYANTYTAIAVVYSIDLSLRWLRKHVARRNVANKTLINSRFLV